MFVGVQSRLLIRSAARSSDRRGGPPRRQIARGERDDHEHRRDHISVSGSVALVCASRLRSRRPTPSAPAIPSVSPIASCTIDRRTNSHQTWRRFGAERHANADLLRALRDRVRRDGVETHCRQHERDDARRSRTSCRTRGRTIASARGSHPSSQSRRAADPDRGRGLPRGACSSAPDGWPSRADQQRHGRRGREAIGHVDDRIGIGLAKVALADRRRDADDGDPRRAPDRPADRAPA